MTEFNVYQSITEFDIYEGVTVPKGEDSKTEIVVVGIIKGEYIEDVNLNKLFSALQDKKCEINIKVLSDINIIELINEISTDE